MGYSRLTMLWQFQVNSEGGSATHTHVPSSVQFSSVTQSCPTLCNPMDCRPPCPSPTPGACSNSCPWSQWCHPTISSSHLQPFPAWVFSNESVLHIRWPKYWSFSFSISPSNEHSGLISFRMDWLDLFAYLIMYFAYNDQFMMYSGYMYPFSLKFPSTQAAASTLNIVPCAIQEVLVGYPF